MGQIQGRNQENKKEGKEVRDTMKRRIKRTQVIGWCETSGKNNNGFQVPGGMEMEMIHRILETLEESSAKKSEKRGRERKGEGGQREWEEGERERLVLNTEMTVKLEKVNEVT